MSLSRIAAAGLAIAAAASFAQSLVPLDPDWREIDAPPPPALKTERLIALEMPGSTLKFGVDPSSISVGQDGIVRYVVVARSSSGVINANYEGIHCQMASVKVYARHNPDSGWVKARDPQWVPLHGTPNSRHSLIIARTGACLGHGANQPASKIARDLASSVETRFDNHGRP
jgi:hypothetical protein